GRGEQRWILSRSPARDLSSRASEALYLFGAAAEAAVGFVFHGSGLRRERGGFDDALGFLHGFAGHAGGGFGHRPGRSHEFGRLVERRHQTVVESVLGAELARGEDELLGPGSADKTRQRGRGDNEPVLRARQPESGTGGRDADIAADGEPRAAAKAVAIDG